MVQPDQDGSTSKAAAAQQEQPARPSVDSAD